MDLGEEIEVFLRQVHDGRIDLYNECSLQHELGHFLRLRLPQDQFKVQFERHVSFFGLDSAAFVKKEIDLSVFAPDKTRRSAIEVKFPRNGQYPEQMFKFCQDIAFVEQLVAVGFDHGHFLAIVDDPLFYSPAAAGGIYGHFRSGVPIQGQIVKPTGKCDESVVIAGNYTVEWKSLDGKRRYVHLEVQRVDPVGA